MTETDERLLPETTNLANNTKPNSKINLKTDALQGNRDGRARAMFFS
jgi:hypothetical protein